MADHHLNALALPGDLIWTDEFQWNPVERATEYAVTGALVVDVGERLAGRPITLESMDDGGWVSRTTLLALYSMAGDPDLTMVLTHGDGRTFNVTFAEPPFEAEQVVAYSDPVGTTWYQLTLRLIEV